MRLIAHHESNTQAVITHDDGELYFYRFASGDGAITMDYERVADTDPVIVEPDNWSVDNLDFDTIGDIEAHLKEKSQDVHTG
jgi:hypothetical protein